MTVDPSTAQAIALIVTIIVLVFVCLELWGGE